MASLPASSCTPRACSAAKPGAGLYASAGLRRTETRTAAVSDRLPDPDWTTHVVRLRLMRDVPAS
jgi:hypothetical protein